MHDTVSQILQWLNTHPELSGLITFCISAAESVAIIGTIVPGTVMMTAIGALAGAGVIPFWSTIIYAILGAIAGDGISYWIGYHFRNRLPHLWIFRRWPSFLEGGENFFRNHGGKSVFIGRFVGPVRAMVPLVAGMLGVKPLRFTIANVISAIGWAPAYMLPGILLGAASLELPPDITIHMMLMLFITSLFIILCIWFLAKLLTLIKKQLNYSLTWIWNKLQGSRYSFITTLLKHHDPNKAYEQLELLICFILASTAFFYLTIYVFLINDPKTIFINNIFFHLFRSLRTPVTDNVMLVITFLGAKSVILPLLIVLSAWFAWTKRWRTAIHTLALGILTVSSIAAMKWMIHEPRPWGILQNNFDGFSFPSGHAALSIIFYLGLGLLLARQIAATYHRLIFILASIIIAAIGVSRLYLGAHWFTDVIGGWLVGAALLMLVTMSYHRQAEFPHKLKEILTRLFNRKSEKKTKSSWIIITALLTLMTSYSIYFYHSFEKLKYSYTQLEWPISTVSLDAWWEQQNDYLPLYRINRFGLAQQIFNVQWVGNLSKIKEILLQNGWRKPPKRDWISILYRLTDVRSTESLPLVSPLYLDKKPVLVLIKSINDNKKLLALRFWKSNIAFANSNQLLWVGTFEAVPSTYSWIKRKRNNGVLLSHELLFTMLPAEYDVREKNITVNINSHHPKEETIIFIKSWS